MKIVQFYFLVLVAVLPVTTFSFITSKFPSKVWSPMSLQSRGRTSGNTNIDIKETSDIQTTDRVLPLELEAELSDSFMRYAMSIIMGRALPDIRDGLKPVHRRILYAMSELGLKPSGGYRKCARVVGEVLGKFHPHGDSSVYEALVRMSQDFVMSKTLVAGHGNFGSQDNDPPAAMRYTECKLSSLAHQSLLSDMDLNTVDFIPNFDGNEMEPVILPARFPMLLLNGATGIAVGMATNIPPHNFGELADGIDAMIERRINDQPEMTNEELYEIIPAPDFPTGGIIMGSHRARQLYDTGRGTILLRAKATFETLKVKSNSGKILEKEAIVVTEVPYLCNKATLLERMAELVNEKKLSGISDLRDESDREGVRIVIELKRDAVPAVVMNNLYLKTGLQSTFPGNFLALSKGGTSPQRFILREAMNEFLSFRFDVVRRRAQHRLIADDMRAHVLDGLLIAIARIDDVIEVIRKEPDRSAAKQALMTLKPKALSNNQSEAVLNLQLGRLTSLDERNLESERLNLESQIKYLKTVMSDPKVVWKEIQEETSDLKKKFATPRKSLIIKSDGVLNDEDLIENDRSVVVVTKRGYIKRMSLDSGAFTKAQNRGTRGKVGVNFRTSSSSSEIAPITNSNNEVVINEDDPSSLLQSQPGDEVKHFFTCNDHDTVLFITSKGVVHAVKAWQIPIATRTARGAPLPSLFVIEKGAHMAAVIPVTFLKTENTTTNEIDNEIEDTDVDTDDDTDDGTDVDTDVVTSQSVIGGKNLIMVTKKGRVKKIPLVAFANIHKRSKGLIGILLTEGDEVKWVRHCEGNNDSIVLATKMGYATRFMLSDKEVKVGTRRTKGVIGMRLRPEDEIVDIDVIRQDTSHLSKKSSTSSMTSKSKKKIEKMPTDKMPTEKMPTEERMKTDILVLTSNGFGKRTKISHFPIRQRGRKGFLAIKFKKLKTNLKGKKKMTSADSIACLRGCAENDDILLSTSSGVIVRQKISNISRQSRLATGVLIQKLNDGATISEVAIVPQTSQTSHASIAKSKSKKKDKKDTPKSPKS